jgi:hypothetical protein
MAGAVSAAAPPTIPAKTRRRDAPFPSTIVSSAWRVVVDAPLRGCWNTVGGL